MARWEVYLPEGWPGLRAPADVFVRISESSGEPYPAAWLWVRNPDGTDDLWSKSVINIASWGPRPPRDEQFRRALREALQMGAELEAERDEFYAEWMPWDALREIGEVMR